MIPHIKKKKVYIFARQDDVIMNKAMLVMGMHRSGTSALTAGMSSAGCFVINNVAPNEDNPKGFFEHQEVQALNDEILRENNSFWGNPSYNSDLDKLSISDKANEHYVRKAEKILLAYKDKSQFVIKDPRLSLLAHFWEPVICNELNAKIHNIVVLRNPLEVISSLLKRNQIHPHLSLGEDRENMLRIWILYNYKLLSNFKSDNNYLVSFDHFLKEPKNILIDIFDKFSLSMDEEKVNQFSDRFLDKNLKHHDFKLSDNELSGISKDLAWAEKLYCDLKSFSAGVITSNEAFALVNKYKDSFEDSFCKTEASGRLLGLYYNRTLELKDKLKTQEEKNRTLVKKLNAQEEKNRTLVEKLNAREEHNRLLENHISAIKNTFIWKLIWPYRFVKDFFIYRRVYYVIKSSGLFDNDYYLNSNNLNKVKVDPIKHFIETGAFNGKDPSPDFNVGYYLKNNPDVKQRNINPLYHYIMNGFMEKRQPKSIFNIYHEVKKFYKKPSAWNIFTQLKLAKEAYYLVRDKKINPGWYYSENMDVYVEHQESIWWKYKESKIVVISIIAKIVLHPVRHYVWHGAFEGRKPTPTFDTFLYLYYYPDVLKAKTNPYYHFCYHGSKEKRSPCGGNDCASDKNIVTNLYIDNKGLYTSCFQSMRKAVHYEPLVTVLVPNYNHSIYLKNRLDSIYNQTYQNFEVILMDDCSQDNSQRILNEYASQYKDKTQLILNEKQSGGVFHQWEKGLTYAKGELVWIAESDDWCSLNFLEELVRFFQDEAVLLAYSRTVFIKSDTNKQFWTIEEYLSDIDQGFWLEPFVCSSQQIMNNAWAIKNIIPNVSSAIFRNPKKLELLNDPEWKNMNTCGDWLFYVHLVQGGLVAYSPKATNYYRIHENNTSIVSYSSDKFYKEHEMVAVNINKLYKVSQNVFIEMRNNIKQHWKLTRDDFSEEAFLKCFDIEIVYGAKKYRKPNVLMCGYAFSAGGGEVFPIELANIIRKAGFAVTYISFEQELMNKGVRNKLDQHIPVVTNYYQLNKIVEIFGIDIIHSHHAWVDNIILDLLDSKLNCKKIITMHGMYESMDYKSFKKLLPRLIQGIDLFVYTADKNLEPFMKADVLTKVNFVKISNALNDRETKKIDLTKLGINKNAFILCMVSRAIPEKGWREAVETIIEARRLSGKDIHLIAIGDGPEYLKLKNNVPDYIHLFGFKENVRDYFSASHLGYLPSRFPGESYPLVVIDCLLSGRPVLASDIGEIANMLKADNDYAGTLFPLNGWEIPIKMVAEIISIYANDETYYGDKLQNVKSAASKFKPEKLLASYVDAYMGLER